MASSNNTVDIKINVESGEANSQLDSLNRSLGQVGQTSAQSGDQLQQMTNALLSADIVQNAIASLGDYAKEVATVADSWNLMQAKLQMATRSTEEYEAAMAAVVAISNSSRADIDEVGNLYIKLSNTLKATGSSQQDVAQLTETITQAMKVSGATTQETSSALTQLGQALASGALRGDEFNSVNESGNRLMVALGNSLGVTTAQLRTMAENGELTTQIITKGLLSQSAVIGEEFGKLPMTIGDSLQLVKNAFAELIGNFDDVNSTSTVIADSIKVVADNLDTLASVAGSVGVYALAQGATAAGKAMTAYAVQIKEAVVAQREQSTATRQAAVVEAQFAADVTAGQAAVAKARATAAAAAIRAAEASVQAAQAQEVEALANRAAAQQINLTGQQRTAIEIEATAAINRRIAAEGQLAAAQKLGVAASADATRAAAAAAAATAATSGAAAAATISVASVGAALAKFAGMLVSLPVMIAGLGSYTIGNWARDQSSIVERAGVSLAKYISLIINSIRGLGDVLISSLTPWDSVNAAIDRWKSRAATLTAGYDKMYDDVDRVRAAREREAAGIDEHGKKIDKNKQQVGALGQQVEAATQQINLQTQALSDQEIKIKSMGDAWKALGVDVDEATTGLTAKQNELKAAIAQLGLEVTLKSDLLATGYTAAIRQAGSSTELLSAATQGAATAYQEGRLDLEGFTAVLESLPASYRATAAAGQEASRQQTAGLAALKAEIQQTEERVKAYDTTLSATTFASAAARDEYLKLTDRLEELKAEYEAVTTTTEVSVEKQKQAFTGLGLDYATVVTGISDKNRALIADFGTVVTAFGKDTETMKTAFDAVLSKLNTVGELGAFQAEVQAAMKAGTLATRGLESELAELERKLAQAEAAVSPVGEAFKTLGLKTKAELQATANQAVAAFRTIAESGQATPKQLAEAWPQVQAAVLAAMGGTSAGMIEANRALDALKLSVPGLSTELAKAGDTGAKAGGQIAGGMDTAGKAIDGVSGKASKAASSLDSVASSTDGAASSVERMSDGTLRLADTAEEASRSIVANFGEAWRSVQQLEDGIADATRRLNDLIGNSAANAAVDFNAKLDEIKATRASIQKEVDFYNSLADAQRFAGGVAPGTSAGQAAAEQKLKELDRQLGLERQIYQIQQQKAADAAIEESNRKAEEGVQKRIDAIEREIAAQERLANSYKSSESSRAAATNEIERLRDKIEQLNRTIGD